MTPAVPLVLGADVLHTEAAPALPRVAPFLQAKLKELDEELGATLPRVLAHAKDDEAIHDMRVAIRRLRTLLRLARPTFGRFHADAVRRAFTDVQRATGALRDEEVLEETLAALPLTDRAFTEWRKRRVSRERALRRSVLVGLRAGELDRAKELLRAVIVLPVKPSRDKDLGKFARKCIERARKEVESRRDVPTTDVLGLHELRIAYKNLRYATEIFAEALPADLAAMTKPAAQFQKRLGEIHDVDMAVVSVARARGLGPRTRAAALRALGDARAKRVAKYVADMSPVAATPKAAPRS